MQLGKTAWEQMSPSSMQFFAHGAGPTWWQVRQPWAPRDEQDEGRWNTGETTLAERLAGVLCVGQSLCPKSPLVVS
jgi:hypothetical protein